MSYFSFTDASGETFVVSIGDPNTVAHARAVLAGTETFDLGIGGKLTLSPSSYNIGWSYHIAPEDVLFFSVSAEVADATMNFIEDHLNEVGQSLLPGNMWLSWSSQLVAELHEVTGGAGTDILEGTAGYDIIFGAAGDDLLSGGLGDDHLLGEAGNDQLNGGDGDDKLSGGNDSDILLGDAGNDVLDGGAGDDQLDGSSGVDTAVYSNAAAGVRVDLALTTAQNTLGAGTDTLANIENLRGSLFDDTLLGDGAANHLMGGLGNDTLSGGAGEDWLEGGAGDDWLDGGAGDDLIEGGDDGSDTVSYASATAAVIVDLATAQSTGGGGFDTVTGIENITGSTFNDTLTGDVGDNILDGGAGSDRLSGGVGNDTASYASAASGVSVNLSIIGSQATGGAGFDTLRSIENLAGSNFNDSLKGNSSANLLQGGTGNDVLDGGAGRDILEGGAGQDFFRFSAIGNVDRLSDFSVADDTILLSRSIFRGISQLGVLNASAFHVGTSAADASDRIIYDEASGRIFYDSDGTGRAKAVLFATVAPGTELTNQDFQVVATTRTLFSTTSFSESVAINNALIGAVGAAGLASAPVAAEKHVAVSLEPQGPDSADRVSAMPPLISETIEHVHDFGEHLSSLGSRGRFFEDHSEFNGHSPFSAVQPLDQHGAGLLPGNEASAAAQILAILPSALAVGIPPAEMLQGRMQDVAEHAVDAPIAGHGVDPAHSTDQMLRVLADSLVGSDQGAPDIDALLNSLPAHAPLGTPFGAPVSPVESADLGWHALAGFTGGHIALPVEIILHQDASPMT